MYLPTLLFDQSDAFFDDVMNDTETFCRDQWDTVCEYLQSPPAIFYLGNYFKSIIEDLDSGHRIVVLVPPPALLPRETRMIGLIIRPEAIRNKEFSPKSHRYITLEVTDIDECFFVCEWISPEKRKNFAQELGGYRALTESEFIEVLKMMSEKEITKKVKAPSRSKAKSGGSMADSLQGLADLHSSGALTDDEFAAAKRKVIGD